MKWLLLTLVAAFTAFGADGPRLIYTKSFPGSTPAFVYILLDKSGMAEYREAMDDDAPIKLQLDPAEVTEMYSLADKLDKFTKPLESGLKVARMGEKTFRFEDGAVKNEQKFNYSMDENAKLLHDQFEKITESALLRANLERSVRFDKLGVNQSLLLVQTAIDKKRLVGKEQFLPLLDRVAKNEAFLHMARERAANLAQAIREPKPAQ